MFIFLSIPFIYHTYQIVLKPFDVKQILKLEILFLFYNDNTWLHIGHKMILFGEEQIQNIFGYEKLWTCLSIIKIYATLAAYGIQTHDLVVTQW